MIKTIFLALALSSFAGAAAHAQCNVATTENCSSSVYEVSQSAMPKVNQWLKSGKKEPIDRLLFDFTNVLKIKVTSFRGDKTVNSFVVSLETFNYIVEQAGIIPSDLVKLARGV